MKFTIEVEEFWIEEESLSHALTSHIRHEVIRDISKNIKDQVEKKITEAVEQRIKDKLDVVIDSTLSDLIESGVIIRGGVEVPLVAHIKDVFLKGTGWNNPDRKMESLAKSFGDDLKAQYNNLFASKIVENMREQGMLKEDVSKLLLNGVKK